MKLQEVIDAFDVTYRFECLKRKEQTIAIPRQLKALWISRAMQDVTQRVKEGQSTFTVIPSGSQSAFQLPDDFSALLSAGLGGVEFDIVDVTALSTNTDLISQVAVYSDGITWFVKFNAVPTGSETVTYYTTNALYSPSGSKSQGIGYFDTQNFKGDFQLRDAYLAAVFEYMLGQIFDDRLARYENEVMKMRQNQSTTISQLTYNMGGVSI